MKNPWSNLIRFRRRIRHLGRVMNLSSAARLTVAESKSGEIVIPFLPTGREIVLRGGTSDIQCMEKVFITKEYESPIPIDPQFIVDAGANIGMATLYFAHKYPKATIVAIEPEPSNFELLTRNCAGYPNVHLLQAGLWPVERRLKIQDANAEKWMFSLAENNDDSATSGQAIKGVTIGGLLREFKFEKIDLLKLDIEGAERDLFEIDPQGWLDSVRQIIIELHDRFLPGCARCFYAAIGSRPFRQEVFGENLFIELQDARAPQACCSPR